MRYIVDWWVKGGSDSIDLHWLFYGRWTANKHYKTRASSASPDNHKVGKTSTPKKIVNLIKFPCKLLAK